MNIGIIGFGHLGRSLCDGLLLSGVPSGEIYVCDHKADKLAAVREKYGVAVSLDINDVVKSADVIFLTVKSAVFEALSESLDCKALCGKTLVSFMAGVTIETLSRLTGGVCEIVRGMPSIAIASCDGVVAYTKAPPSVVGLLGKLGYAFEVPPEDIEKVMAFASCGLGFAAYLIDAFAKAGEAMGFSRGECERIASQTFRNAVDIGDFEATVAHVATKGGATEQGVLHMDGRDVKGAVAEAVRKAYEKMI